MTGIRGNLKMFGPRAPKLEPRDGHFLAGIIDAEGCFRVNANNGGASWRCDFSLALRDDDADLLVELHRSTGLGYLKSKPAQRTSMPQVLWSVQSRRECLQLADLLERFPLRGRKRLDVAVWTKAVRELERSPDPDCLPRLAADLRSVKRYVNPAREPRTTARLDDDLVAYFGGFFTGEGHLSISGKQCRVAIKLRGDDRPLLEDLAAATRLGRLYPAPRSGSSQPSIAWVVYRQDQLVDALRLLEVAGLRGRKARELPAWRSAALEFAGARAEGRRRNATVVEEARVSLRAARAYRARAPFQTASQEERRSERCLDALHEFAHATSEALTVTAYSAHRQTNQEWPNRDTIVRLFGSWSAALNAAGLGSRAVRAARRATCEPAEFTWSELTRRCSERGRVVAVVSELKASSGRSPTVHEYLAWRGDHDRSLPYLSKVYDLFPGGWSSVRRVASAHSPSATSARG